MNIVFCADHGVLPGLHVAAYSLLENISPTAPKTHFYVFSDALGDSDMALLEKSLESTGKPFALELKQVDAAMFSGFPSLNGSWATYYRLAAPKILDVDRFLYVDADTLCGADVSPLLNLDMGNYPAAWVPEAPLDKAADRSVAEQLGNSSSESYFNAGLMLVDGIQWRKQQITERALEYIGKHRPQFHDQSALNVVLHGNALALDERFNCIANMRKHWPALAFKKELPNKLIHFLDYPKPWDFGSEFIHPQYDMWRSILEKTEMRDFRSWQATPCRKYPKTSKARTGYKKAIKDRFLFKGYSSGWIKKIKGIPA